MKGRFEGKRAIVTGAARGIGAAISRELAEGGARLAMVDLDEDRLCETVNAFCSDGYEAMACPADVSDTEAAKRVVHQVTAAWDGIDYLVNNAGITRDGLLMRMRREDWDLVLRVNLDSVFLFSQAVLKTMMKARYGRMVNIGSVVGVMGNPGQVNYSASKAGIIGFSRSLAREVASRGITVNVIAPGYIATEMTAGLTEDVQKQLLARVPLGRLGTAEDVARGCAFLLSDDAGYITGQVLGINGGMYM